MTRLRTILAYPIAYALIWSIMYGQAPGYPLKNAWKDWRR